MDQKEVEKKGTRKYIQEYKYSASNLLMEIENYFYLL